MPPSTFKKIVKRKWEGDEEGEEEEKEGEREREKERIRLKRIDTFIDYCEKVSDSDINQDTHMANLAFIAYNTRELFAAAGNFILDTIEKRHFLESVEKQIPINSNPNHASELYLLVSGPKKNHPIISDNVDYYKNIFLPAKRLLIISNQYARRQLKRIISLKYNNNFTKEDEDTEECISHVYNNKISKQKRAIIIEHMIMLEKLSCRQLSVLLKANKKNTISSSSSSASILC